MNNEVYLDYEQCEYFGVAYMHSNATLVINAKTLLNSKANGYDEYHFNLLTPFQDVILERNDKTNSPGWFSISKVLYPGDEAFIEYIS